MPGNTMALDWIKIGTCKACGQQLLLTALDCWHPHNVPVACPPEISDNGFAVAAWGRFGRPGIEYFVENQPTPKETP